MDYQLTEVARVSFTIRGLSLNGADPTNWMNFAKENGEAAHSIWTHERAIVDALNKHFAFQFRVSRGDIFEGSIKYKDGQIVVTTPTLAALVVAYGLMVNYNDFKSGVSSFLSDVKAITETALSQLGATDIRVVPTNHNHIEEEILLATPPSARRNLRQK